MLMVLLMLMMNVMQIFAFGETLIKMVQQMKESYSLWNLLEWNL